MLLNNFCYVTNTASSHTKSFIIELSEVELLRLSERYLLGFRFAKNKYEFLNDLRDILVEEILWHLNSLTASDMPMGQQIRTLGHMEEDLHENT
jgi:hypothetical protein